VRPLQSELGTHTRLRGGCGCRDDEGSVSDSPLTPQTGSSPLPSSQLPAALLRLPASSLLALAACVPLRRVYHEFGGPIRVEDVPVPVAPPGGVVIEVRATGVCRSDWHGWSGHDSDIEDHGLPFTPGHELNGVIASLGEGVTTFSIGERVAVPFILSCGTCRECLRSKPTVCEDQEQPVRVRKDGPLVRLQRQIYRIAVHSCDSSPGLNAARCLSLLPQGFTMHGSFAEFVALPRAERNISHLPDEVSFSAAAALGCRTTTAFRAVVQQGRLVEGEVLAVFGCGGVGLSGALPPAENASLFWSFPYVCPEPVLINYRQQR